jgi:hypothetical protein
LQAVLRTTSAEPKPKVVHRFADFACQAIVKLEAQAQAADAVAQGKGQ